MKNIILPLILAAMIASCSSDDLNAQEPIVEEPIVEQPEEPVIPEPEPIDQTVNPDWVIGYYFSEIYNFESETPRMIQFTHDVCEADLNLMDYPYSNSYHFMRDVGETDWQPLTEVVVTENMIQWKQYSIFLEKELTFTFNKIDEEGDIIQVWVFDHVTGEHKSFGNFIKYE